MATTRKIEQKKVILFIVDGPSDETTFALIVSRIIRNIGRLRFHVLRGDLTCERGVTPQNVCNRITGLVNQFLRSSIYKKSDISQIVHLIDTDGVFIHDSLIENDQSSPLTYTTNKIITNNPYGIQTRNANKSNIVRRLSSTGIMYVNIPYSVYYFSCNLEHVLHDEQNASDERKKELAFIFRAKYEDDILGFLAYIHNPQIAVNGTYQETWGYIVNDKHSLERHCNFHLFFDKILSTI